MMPRRLSIRHMPILPKETMHCRSSATFRSEQDHCSRNIQTNMVSGRMFCLASKTKTGTNSIPFIGLIDGVGVSPEPGFVVGHPNFDGSGHVGIVDYDGYAIGAGERIVSRKFSDFLDGNSGYNCWKGEDP